MGSDALPRGSGKVAHKNNHHITPNAISAGPITSGYAISEAASSIATVTTNASGPIGQKSASVTRSAGRASLISRHHTTPAPYSRTTSEVYDTNASYLLHLHS